MTPNIYGRYSPVFNRVLAGIILFLALRFVDTAAYRSASNPGGLFACDFGALYAASHRLNEGQHLYLREAGQMDYQYVSSPLLPILVRPLAKLPLVRATCAWAALNVVLMTLATLLYCWGARIRLLEQVGFVILILLTGFRFWPTTLELAIGNTDIVLLFLAAGMFVCNRYQKWFLFALLVAIGALTKTWMIGALFYLLVRRKWGAAFAGIGFFAAGLAILFSIVGWSEMPVLRHLTQSYSSQPDLVSNSVVGMARMYFSYNTIITPLVASSTFRMAFLVIGYGFLVGGLIYLWFVAPAMDEGQLQVTLGLTFTALVLGCPVCHQYYFVLVLPLLWSLLLPSGKGKVRWVLAIAVFFIYLAYTVPTPSLNPVPMEDRHGWKSLMVAASFFSGMLLWACGLWSVSRGFPVGQFAPALPDAPVERRIGEEGMIAAGDVPA